MARICELPDCHVSFLPKREWQKCCSVEHGRKLRYLRRKEKQAKLLEASRVEVAILETIKVDNPRSSVKVEGVI